MAFSRKNNFSRSVAARSRRRGLLQAAAYQGPGTPAQASLDQLGPEGCLPLHSWLLSRARGSCRRARSRRPPPVPPRAWAPAGSEDRGLLDKREATNESQRSQSSAQRPAAGVDNPRLLRPPIGECPGSWVPTRAEHGRMAAVPLHDACGCPAAEERAGRIARARAAAHRRLGNSRRQQSDPAPLGPLRQVRELRGQNMVPVTLSTPGHKNDITVCCRLRFCGLPALLQGRPPESRNVPAGGDLRQAAGRGSRPVSALRPPAVCCCRARRPRRVVPRPCSCAGSRFTSSAQAASGIAHCRSKLGFMP